MKNGLYIFSVLFFLIQVNSELFAQFNLTAYQLNKTLPQANVINPGFIPDSKVVVGLPAISGIYASGSVPARLSSFIDHTVDDSLQIDLDKFVNKLGKKNDFSINAQASLIYVGVRINKGYLSFNARSLNSANLTFPKELVELAIYGNGVESLIGEDIDLSSLRSRNTSFISVGVGYAQSFLDDKLTVGMRLSYIKGILSAETEKGSEITLRTNEQDYSIYMATDNLTANISGSALFSDSIDSPVDYILNSKNRGFGFDIGGIYKINDQLSISGAITDLGNISWKTDVVNYNINDSSYTYSGFDLENMDNFGDDILDTLEVIFDPTETENSYSTGLLTKFYAGAHYQFGRIQSVDAVLQGVIIKGRIRSAISLSYGIKLTRVLNARISYSVIDGGGTNLGLGFTANAGFFQLFAVSDNLIGLISPQYATYTNVRLGLNLTFGRKSLRQ
ncbi:DUF5723 family protein [Bacteroidota bacterium]